MTDAAYQPLFPYFGGKSPVAGVVWRALGDVDRYVEPFFGSGAVLFKRPATHSARYESVNDADGMVANFWRAVKSDPEAVAMHADNPVNECDLHARHLWLVGRRESIADRVCADPHWYDAKAAGWWVWGMSTAITGNWMTGGSWVARDGRLVKDDHYRPDGICRARPHIGTHLGVNRYARGPIAGACDRHAEKLRREIKWFADRLRHVEVLCGDWSRACGSYTTTTQQGTCGVFLDPPYADTAGRATGLYAVDCQNVAHRVREWAIANGDGPEFRIVLAGYEGEHKMPGTWRKHEWTAQGGMACIGNGNGKTNRFRERLWFSPHCLDVRDQVTLFAGDGRA